MGLLATKATKNTKDFLVFVIFVTFVADLFVGFVAAREHDTQASPARVISLVPALTEMVYAIGAGGTVVAVSSYDDNPPAVLKLPKVGALLDPDVERIIALRPDLVLVYGSQTDLKTQLTRAGIAHFDYRHGGLAHVTETMRTLGERLGRADDARRVATDIERRIQSIRVRVAGRGTPKTLLVFGREPRALRNIYVSGGRGFLHDMLIAAGGTNVFADIQAESVQVSSEQILARAPEAIIELEAKGMFTPKALEQELAAWRPLASVPAVRAGRIHILTGRDLVVPGPDVATGVERMARALHPGAF